MPTYEYQCEKCGLMEIWQSIKDNALTACPTCGSKVERQISANIGFVFKGSGFYQNEYKNQPKSPEVVPSAATGQAPKDASKPELKTSEKTAPLPSAGSTPSMDSGPGCGTCGSPAPCPSEN